MTFQIPRVSSVVRAAVAIVAIVTSPSIVRLCVIASGRAVGRSLLRGLPPSPWTMDDGRGAIVYRVLPKGRVQGAGTTSKLVLDVLMIIGDCQDGSTLR